MSLILQKYFPTAYQLYVLYVWARRQCTDSFSALYINVPFCRGLVLDVRSRTVSLKPKGNIWLLVCEPHEIELTLSRLEQSAPDIASLHCIYSSDDMEVWENKTLHIEPPIRLGLTSTEKRDILHLARFAVDTQMRETDMPHHQVEYISPKFKQLASVCVAIWHDGKIRGSIIRSNMPLKEAIIKASIVSCSDSRFKSLAAEELSDSQIEVSIMSDLRLPLSRKAMVGGKINPRNGYLISGSEQDGWYVPEIFNCRRFKDFSELIQKLSSEKAKSENTERCVVYTFNVENFLESRNHQAVLSMGGPLCLPVHANTSADFFNRLIRSANDAGNQLVRIQNPDGSIPSATNPLSGDVEEIRWSPLAYALWGLASFGKSVENKSFVQAASIGFNYLGQALFTNSSINLNTRAHAIVYYGHLASVLGEKDLVEKAENFILTHKMQLTYHPILYANTSSFLAMHGHSSEAKDVALALAKIVRKDLETQRNQKQDIELAAYAELIRTYSFLQDAGSKDYEHIIKNVREWLLNHLSEDTGFLGSTHNTVASYASGTAKMFEVLAADYERNAGAIHKAFSWLETLQYRDENLHFVSSSERESVKGAFRHSALNHEARIDSSGHFLVGVSRIIHASG